MGGLKSRRYRGGTPGGDADRGRDGSDGRGLVATLTAYRAIRPVHVGPGPPTASDDLRRRSRETVRERVELVHGGGQGDVRPRQDEPGRAVLAHLRRPLPQALRTPALKSRSVPEEAVRERESEAGLDTERFGHD